MIGLAAVLITGEMAASFPVLQNVSCTGSRPSSSIGYSLTLMRKILLRLCLILLLPTLFSCDPGDQPGYHGYLYFAKSHYLMRYGLKDGSLSVVTNLGDKRIHDISSFLENRLLIAESASVNRMGVRRISWVDVNTGQTAALYSGILARFLEGSGIVVYDDGERLFTVALASDSDSETIFTHKMYQISTLMVVSKDTVLFETNDDGEWRIRSYNVITGTLKTLDRLSGICRLDQAVWINDLEQFACKERSNQSEYASYILTDLNGDVSGTLALPEGKHFDALAYISGQSALVLQESSSGFFGGQDKSAIWVYNIQSGESHRLAKSQNLGSSVVYSKF